MAMYSPEAEVRISITEDGNFREGEFSWYLWKKPTSNLNINF
jgi:hypothetical protein